MVDQTKICETLDRNRDVQFVGKDIGQCLHAQLTLGEHGWHCAACLRTFLPSGETGAEQEAVRLRYQLTDTRSALQKRDQEVAELRKKLHDANNEIMALRGERDELRIAVAEAYIFLAYAAPDSELVDDEPKWMADCDAWLEKYPPSKFSSIPKPIETADITNG